MIVRDEAHNLSDCLTPIAHLFDEIVIVDTGSRDNTKEIARRFTSLVFDFEWCDDFAAARNESLRHATGDWIFWLDADDRLHPDQVQKLASLLATELDERPRIFLMDTVVTPAEAGKDTLVTSHARLFRRHPEMRWKGRVHEQLRPEPISLGYQWQFTDIQIEHIGYHDRALAARKSRRKLRLLRMDYAVDPNDPSTLLHLALAQLGGNAKAEARQHLIKLTQMGSAARPHLSRVYAALADLSLLDGQAHEAVALIDQGLTLQPANTHLLLAKANALYALQQHDQSATVLETILSLPLSLSCRLAETTDVQSKAAPRMLAAVRRMQRRWNEAEILLCGVLKRFPDDLTSWHHLGLVYLDQAKGQELARIVSRLAATTGGRIGAGTLTSLWHMRHGHLPSAGPLIDELIAEAPSLPCLRMLRAEWLSRSGAILAEQLRALRDVLRVQPGSLEAKRWIATIEERQRMLAAAPAPVPFAAGATVLGATAQAT